jgi:hypothetical protein
MSPIKRTYGHPQLGRTRRLQAAALNQSINREAVVGTVL